MKYKITEIIEKDRKGAIIRHGFVIKKRTWYGWKTVQYAIEYGGAEHYILCKLTQVKSDID